MSMHNGRAANWIVTMLAIGAYGSLGAAVSALAAEQGPPQVGEDYQEAINDAWEEAVAGESPIMRCATVKGRAANSEGPEALPALLACNVDIPARYFHTYLDGVAAGERNCPGLMREVATKLSAMTMSADAIKDMVQGAAQGEEAGSAVAAALQSATSDTGELEDPRALVKASMAERTRALCPDFADIILR